MNTLFILFPLSKKATESPDHLYLKQVDWDKSEQTAHIKNIIQTLKMISHEHYEGFFNKVQRDDFYKSVVNRAEYPNASMMLEFFTNWRETPQNEISSISLKGSLLVNDSLGILVGRTHGAIIDVDALQHEPAKTLQLKDADGIELDVDILKCSDEVLYLWFVEYRDPQRVFDRAYKKHGMQSHKMHGKTISALTYSSEEVETFLKQAVGDQDDKRLYFPIPQDKKIVAFCNENLQFAPTYHAYEISDDDEKELAKLSHDLKKKLRRIIKISSEVTETVATDPLTHNEQ